MEFALAPTERAAPPWSGVALRAVCLDIDDTLIDFTAASRRALAAMIGRADMWPLWEAITEEYVAMVVAGEVSYASMHRLRTRSFLAELGVELGEGDAARFEHRRSARMYAGFRLFDDVLPCLRWLRAAGVPVVAVTNASGAHQRQKLAALGIDGFVDHVVIAGEVGTAKPDPVIFHTACSLVDCAPEEAIHVGDKLGADARGARDAGLLGVWLRRDPSVRADSDDDVPVINALDELPGLLACEYTAAAMPVPR